MQAAPLTPEDIVPAIRRRECRKIEVDGFRNASYFADSRGFVYSMHNPREPKIVDQKMGNGLMWVTLFEKEGMIRKVMVGDIIAGTFLKRDDDLSGFDTVVYLDGNPENNSLDNLRWGTNQEQQSQLRQTQMDKELGSSGTERAVATATGSKRIESSDSLIPLKIDREDDPLMDQLKALQKQLDEKDKRENELMKALQPFAEFHLSAAHRAELGQKKVLESNKGTNRQSSLTVQDFRKAREVIEGGRGGREG